MADVSTVLCHRCGGRVPDVALDVPDDYLASPGCFAAWGEVLARSYEGADHRDVHQLVVDAWVVQHGGGVSRQAVQRTALCLMTLQLFLEEGVDPVEGARLHHEMVEHRPPAFMWLVPPAEGATRTTVVEVLAATTVETYRALAWEWAGEVWRAWHEHHAVIREWNRHER